MPNVTITAHHLLEAFLDLHGLTPDFSEWTEEKLASNPPRLIRLKRLKAMFLAFGMEWDPHALQKANAWMKSWPSIQ